MYLLSNFQFDVRNLNIYACILKAQSHSISMSGRSQSRRNDFLSVYPLEWELDFQCFTFNLSIHWERAFTLMSNNRISISGVTPHLGAHGKNFKRSPLHYYIVMKWTKIPPHNRILVQYILDGEPLSLGGPWVHPVWALYSYATDF